MFLTFGNITFQGIKLPQTFESSFETNYGQIPIIASKPVVQGTGEKLDEHDLTAYFHIDFCTPRTEVNVLQTMRKAGTVSYLVDGTGKNYGRFVITTLQESKVTCLNDGYETSITIQIHLLEYNTNASMIKQTGSALVSQNPVKEEPVATKQSIAPKADSRKHNPK
jgi:phage protein U